MGTDLTANHRRRRRSLRVAGALAGLAAGVALALFPLAESGATNPRGTSRSVSIAVPSFVGSIEVVKSLNADIEIRRDGSVDVTETIVYDFGTNFRHGIYRRLPVRFSVSASQVKSLDPTADSSVNYERVTPLSDVSVSSPDSNTPSDYQIETDGAYEIMKIGDPNETITGVHTYVLRYRLSGVLNGFSDHDELYFNVVGGQWDVDLSTVTATVHAPGKISKVACYYGEYQSTNECASASVTASDTAAVRQTSLSGTSAMTVVVALPKGVVSAPKPILEEVWSLSRAFSLNGKTVGAAGGLLGVLAGMIGVLGFRVGRDRRFVGSATDQAYGNVSGDEERVPLFGKEPIPVEYTPPDGLAPGLVGTLIDEVAHPLDVTATIVDLAVRGFLHIEEIPAEGRFGSADYRLTMLKTTDGLSRYEAVLMNHLFAAGSSTLLSSLKTHFRAQLGEVQDLLYREMTDRGWYRRRPDQQRIKWAGIGVAVLVFGVVLTWLLARTSTWGLVGLVFIVAGLVLAIGSHRMPSRTGKGNATYRRVVGFREMFLAGEGDRQAWVEQQNLFSKYLPYAIVFGCADKWAETFSRLTAEGVVQQDSLGWWASPRPFDWIVFSHSMNSFSTTAAGQLSAAAPPTPSAGGSSGFGGGGFSGGGFGGGGGGSW